nr:ROK family protein [Streptomyces sp. SM14]
MGGTGMKAALIDATGTPVLRRRRSTPRAEGPEAMLAAVLDFAAELHVTGVRELGAAPVAAGVVVPGILDEPAGVVRYAANLGWRDLPLRRLLSERLAGLPVALGHDVRTGGLAEGRLGAGEGSDRFFFIPLGTGISGAIGIDGRVEPGAHSGAGEIGHLVVRPGGPDCGCGQRGCLEAVASAAAVGRDWAERCGDPDADAADAARAVAAGDPAATEVWQRAVDALADGLLMATTLLDPEVVIVGGGLAEAGDTLLVPLRAALRERITFQHEPRLVRAALGDSAGCLGAGLLARELADRAVAEAAAEAAATETAETAATETAAAGTASSVTAPTSGTTAPTPRRSQIP